MVNLRITVISMSKIYASNFVEKILSFIACCFNNNMFANLLTREVITCLNMFTDTFENLTFFNYSIVMV